MTSADDLLDGARRITEIPEARAGGWWARAAAMLCRQALEVAVAEALQARGADPERTPASTQLLALRVVVGAETAERARAALTALAAATQRRPWDPPTGPAEVRGWIATVGDLLDAHDVARETAPRHTPGSEATWAARSERGS